MATTKTLQPTVFLWEGVDKRGNKIKGEQTASNPSILKADLRRQGINPKRVRKKPKAIFGASGKRITPQDIAVFSRQLATMMNAGVPMVQAFEIIGGGRKTPGWGR